MLEQKMTYKIEYLRAAADTFFAQENFPAEKYESILKALFLFFSSMQIHSLYKYRSNEDLENRDKDLLENNQIWISEMDKLNDPFEFPVKYNPDLLHQSEVHCRLWQTFLGTRARCCVFSMCEEKDNLLLWAHYANAHRGYCVEYDAGDIFKSAQSFLLPAVYKDEFVDFTPGNARIGEKELYEKLMESIVVKSTAWEYEKEWRFVRVLPVDARKDQHKIYFPQPTAFYLGCCAEKKLETQLAELCKIKRIPLFRMQASEYSFAITPRRVDI